MILNLIYFDLKTSKFYKNESIIIIKKKFFIYVNHFF